MTLEGLGASPEELRSSAELAGREGFAFTSRALAYLAEVLERADDVRSDALNGVVDYILNGRDCYGKEERGS